MRGGASFSFARRWRFVAAALLAAACGRIAGLGEPTLDTTPTPGRGSAGQGGESPLGAGGEPSLAGAPHLGGADPGGTDGDMGGEPSVGGADGSSGTGCSSSACVLDISNLDECTLE